MTDQHLRRALRPFADIADDYRRVAEKNGHGGHADTHRVSIDLGTCRRAASALAETDITTDGAHPRRALERRMLIERALIVNLRAEYAPWPAQAPIPMTGPPLRLSGVEDAVFALESLFASPPTEGLREAIARVIDPKPFEAFEKHKALCEELVDHAWRSYLR